MSCALETGPIRPPSEAQSLLLRVVRNCPWNRCVFCPVYKGSKFSKRTVAEVKNDIDIVARIVEAIRELGKDPDKDTLSDLTGKEGIPLQDIQHVTSWVNHGMANVFLQDGDALVIKSEEILEILTYLRQKFPGIRRITTYSRAKTLSKKSLDNLREIRKAGLNRIHIGMESGSDKVLSLIKKGVSAAEQIEAGRRVMEAGFELSEYFMPGIGGRLYSEDNARESARVINEINPTFVRLRTTVPIPGTPLHTLMQEKKWQPLSEIGKIEEIELFIKNLKDITSTIRSDHIMNLLEDVQGKFPADKEKILTLLRHFLNMTKDNQESFIIGRRLGWYRNLIDNPDNSQIEQIKAELKSRYDSIDEAVMELSRKYL